MDSVSAQDNISSSLLDEVFNEVDSEEEPAPSKSGFLEDVAADEIESALNKKKLEKSKIGETVTEVNAKEKEEDSLIHGGLTDSSDDEDNKYFEESKYNDCGKKIKNLLRERNGGKTSVESVRQRDSTFKNDENRTPIDGGARERLQKILEKIKKDESGVEVKGPGRVETDPVLHMRIVNPLVSSAKLKEKMIGRISVGTLKIKKFLESSQSKTIDWVTGGVITHKLSKTSQKGNVYAIWELSDLYGDIKTVSVFLFGSAYKEFWTTVVGTVVGILNPDSMNNNNDRHEATLKVENPHKILVLGMSKDFGTCKGKIKSGESCRAVVNTAKCEFCTRHLQKEYKQACRRMDLQPPKIGRLLEFKNQLMGNKSRQSSGGDKITFRRITGKKSEKQLEKDRRILESLSLDPSATQTVRSPVTPSVSNQAKAPPSDSTTKPNEIKSKVPEIKPISHPQLPSKQTGYINLSAKITAAERARAKANALVYVREHGPLKAPVDKERGKRTPEQISSVKRKLEIEDSEKRKKVKESENVTKGPEPDPKKQKLEKLGLTDKFFELMNAGVKNQMLLETAEKDQQDKYFDKLETREKLENKMATTFKVECNAVRCLKCHYKAFSASDICKREKHPLKVFKAMKRFWKCSNCPARTVSLELVPLHPCKTCGSAKWEKSSMMPEKGPNLIIEPLSVRGMEEKFIGATVKNASLSLLVPDEGDRP